jgi:hypothetical protein
MAFLVLLMGNSPSDAARVLAQGDPTTEAYVDVVRAESAKIQAEVYAELGLKVQGDTHVFVSRDASSMVAQAGREQGSTPPEWAAGLAYPQARKIYMHASVPLDDFRVTLRHELSHIAFGQVTANQRAPRWFVEGVAVWQSESFDMGRAWLLTEAAMMGTIYPLDQLDRGFPSNGVRAGVAYAQAVHFVGFLHGRYGAEKFGQFIAVLGHGDEEFAAAFYRVYDTPLSSLETEWRGAIRARWGWVGVIFGETSLWVFAAFLLFLGWLRRRRERHTRLDALRRDEERDAPDELMPRPIDPSVMDENDEARPYLH